MRFGRSWGVIKTGEEKQMNEKGEICLGLAGAGRAAELHMNGLRLFI